jgi:outer membrane protein
MKNITKTLLPLALLASVTAHADIIGGSIEASYWYSSPDGDAMLGGSNVNLENDLGLDDSSFFEIAATVEHPVPLIPNVRVKYLDMDQTGKSTLSTPFNGVSGAVETNLDLSHVDFILYYEILDNWVSVDIGLNTKIFDGQLEVKEVGGTGTSTTKIDKFLPLAYASAEFELPFTDMSFGAELSALTYSDTSIYDAKARFRQGFSLAFVELGYRQMGIKIENVNSLEVDTNFGGFYLSTGLDF